VLEGRENTTEEFTLAAKGKTKSAKKGKQKSTGVDQKLVKALAHPLRVEILTILNERMASPNELSKELDEGLSQVSYHVKVLKDFECIEMVKTEPRRGAVEHYYRATARAFISDADWRKMPDSIKPGVTSSFIKMLIEDVIAVVQGGNFDKREDRHVSWTPGVVDEQAWAEIIELLEETLKKIIAIQTKAAGRLAKAGEKGIPMTVAMLGYEGLEQNTKGKAKAKAKSRKASKKA
jgi:DNA-binding transcriptional ArsR family regulator